MPVTEISSSLTFLSRFLTLNLSLLLHKMGLTSLTSELGGIGGPSREKTRLNSSSLILAVPLDGYQPSFQSVWKIIRRLSLPSSCREPLLFPQGSWGSEEVPEGVGLYGSVHWYWSFIVIIKADFDWDLTLHQALCKVFLIVSFNPFYKNRIRSELRYRGELAMLTHVPVVEP